MDYFIEKYNQFMLKIMNEATWIDLGLIILKIIVIVILTRIVIRVGKIAIHNLFKVRTKSPLRTSERREKTVMKLLENILTYVVSFMSFLMILSTLSIEVKPLLAGAGIVGLAVGFGAQNLVKDIITGFFIIFEDQFSVGDQVRIGTFEGVVQEIGLRTTKIKSWTGELHILPNGSIVQVTNFSLHNSKATIDISMANETDLIRIEEVIRQFLDTLPEKYEDLVKVPELLGVQALGASETIMRIAIETKPMKQVAVSRMVKKDLKLWLDQQGFEIQYP
ncbi:mechanosensitive ion channel family protein [Bacillus sp. CGMCC 1.16607]|uniref:mechanosensitive ion channel family protein n=1 Tax=Bacillus sp. CGMCC 1.16607 TaxID=3351842 RepID=UPI0036279206